MRETWSIMRASKGWLTVRHDSYASRISAVCLNRAVLVSIVELNCDASLGRSAP
jgi:hypothetical protein